MLRSPERQQPVGSDALLDYSVWNRKIEGLVRAYEEARPFPHAVLSPLLLPEIIGQLEKDVPSATAEGWTHYKHFNERKQGKSRRDEMPESILGVIDELNSERFRALLSRLTGVADLLPDEDFSAGGGLSLCERSGFLNIHTDFTVHPYHPNWRRRVNLIFYLNHDWDEAWGGHTELWDSDVSGCAARIAPHANTALVFNTDIPSYHGHPEPLACPEGVARKTLALYYFTEEDDPVSLGTLYRPRPTDGWLRRTLIVVDRTLVGIYHALKQRLGISDAFASGVLARLSSLAKRSSRR